jgi:peptidoglycan/LPS O-acetylase OafA/YrhL
MSHSHSYRPDIDGLRAIAILAVVGFHAFPNFVPGGYVGVDVFFVISGFLISSLILNGLERKTFSFADFYVRRTKRIFPALALVLATCLPLGWLWLTPGEFVALGKHIVSGATFVTNIIQWKEAGYFDVSAQYKPLLHLWSLGIEEQFYLACPLITMLAWRYGRVFSVGIIFVVVSFAVNLAFVRAHSIAVFYLPFSRVWELVLGSCLATFPPKLYLPALKSRSLKDASGFAGAALIITAVASFDSHTLFPGWRALLPTIGTVLIIWSGPSAWLNRKVLAHPAPVFVGLISYPLYLWHWPLLSFLAISNASTPLLRTGAIALAIALSWVTYRFLEMPVRHSRSSIWMPLAISLGAIAVFAGAVYKSALPPKSNDPQLAAIDKAANDFVFPIGEPFVFKDQTFYRDGASPKTILFIGDSNMQQYAVRLHEVLDKSGNTISAIYATSGGCVPIPGIFRKTHPACQPFAMRAFEFAKSKHFNTVVVAAQWNGYFTSDQIEFDKLPLNTELES